MSKPIRLKKDGTPDMRGRSAGSRRTQFKPRSVVEKTPEAKASPQVRAQKRKLRVSKPKSKRVDISKVTKTRRQELPHRRLQKMIDEVYDISGKSIRKSLTGMAQRLGASPDDILRIREASEAELERIYKENQYLFESYWDYPLYVGEERSETLEEILVLAGV